MALDHEKHAELLALLLSADRAESEALNALNDFASGNEIDPDRLAALVAASDTAAEKRRGILKALNDLLESY